MASIVFALVASIAYGCSDFFAGSATRRAGALPVTFVSSCVGLVLIAVPAIVYPGVATPSDLLYGLLGGLCGSIGFLLFYAALGESFMGIVAAITSVTTDFVPLIAGLLHGDHLHETQLCGIALALFAVGFVSVSAGSDVRVTSFLGIVQALAGGLCFGATITFLGSAHGEARLWPLLVATCGSVLFLLGIVLCTRTSVRMTKAPFGLSALAGSLCIAGTVFFLISRYAGELSIAAVVSSLSPLVLVALARIFLNERLRIGQLIAILAAVVGVVLIAM